MNNKIKCIAIDDEPLALDIISDYVARIPFLELLNTYRNALLALEFIQNNQVDLIFLDINMPEINGIDFFKSLNTKPKVIFTTAYSEFAVESYELNATDYLLKPIEFERFLKAVNKIYFSQNIDSTEEKKQIEPKDSILLKSGSKSYKIKTKDILYVEGSGNYLTFHTIDKKLMVLMSMSDALILLPEIEFARIHKSYIVSTNHISILENHQIQINSKTIPVGKYYKESFLNKVKEL
ncbi:MAG: response regulator [Bacteroidales bacterium]|nr:response regulator [Bacteroidales bacterium]